MKDGDLTTLSDVKLWLGIPMDDTSSDALLQLMISAASRFVLGYLGRETLAARDVLEIYDGYGNSFMMLRQWPVIKINSIEFYGTRITEPSTGNPRSSGYILMPTDGDPAGLTGMKRLQLWGYVFPCARAAVAIDYRAGYLITDEPHVVSAPVADPPTPAMVKTCQLLLEDGGVRYADTLEPLTYVKASPAEGQYTLVEGVYVFNDADAGKEVLITYSYVPADINEAVFMLVGEQFRYKDRIGLRSKALSGGVGETVSFNRDSMTQYVEQLLQPYRKVVPV